MHKRLGLRLGLGLGALGVALAACAGPTPTPAVAPSAAARPAAAPPAVSAEHAAPAGADAVPASEPAPVAEAPAAPEKQPEAEAEQKPSHPPVDILTSPDTAFLINYTGSAPLETARKTCAAKGGTDDEAIAKCMADARAAFKADVLRFKKDGSHWSCIVYKRDNSRLDEVYSARVDLSEDAPNRVKLKFTGAEKGMRVLLRSKRDTVIQVPNDYSFVLTDPEWGTLVYEAKVGLIAN